MPTDTNGAPDLFAQLDSLFHPRSVAVVGVPRGMRGGKIFLLALLDQKFPGPIYPVNPSADRIEGLPAFPSVTAIPGPVDLAIVSVPHTQALPVIRECAAKGVKGAVLFTSGYRETGSREGAALEEELLQAARKGGMRLIGPNGMGLYAPRTGLSFFPRLSREPGNIGVLSHSGSLTNILGRIGPQKGLRFSKMVSLGNEVDLSFADFLHYLARDPETGLIGGYLESIKDGTAFLAALKAAARQKPVVLWKVGLTPEGARAAVSHTGALIGPRAVWEGVARQTGAICVQGFEPWLDALMGFDMLPAGLGERMAVISGPGGLAVGAAEACGNLGLRLARLSDQTTERLAELVPATGTSIRNPVDVGLTPALKPELYAMVSRAVLADPGVDAAVVIGIGLSPEANEHYIRTMIELAGETPKPVVMVNLPGFDPQLAQHFCRAGIPFFETAERALATYVRVRRDQLRRSRRSNL